MSSTAAPAPAESVDTVDHITVLDPTDPMASPIFTGKPQFAPAHLVDGTYPAVTLDGQPLTVTVVGVCVSVRPA